MNPTPSEAPVQLVFDGSFGALVAAAVAETLDTAYETRLVALSECADNPGAVMAAGRTTVLVTSRFDWRQVHAFDAASHRLSVPWCFVGYAYPYVFVGPHVVPDDGPCYLCLQVRLKQHGRTEVPLRGVDVPVRGDHVEGIPRHLAYTVAGLLSGLLEPTGRGRPRSVYLLHVNGLKVRAEALTAVHDCPRCTRPASAGRGNAQLLRLYRDLWEK
ncbi:TOMM precursor leader peptide-binding protein [Plantactinospora sp. B5E13]|uniref:TOMM precursor leader peptide-binding protein n=1 Tax=unclassified Plantactinospora TaxID=2631981 RepID=UPI00325E9D46